MLDLLAAEPVRRRFGFAENDLETITRWVEQAGVRWAYDEQHRAPYGLDGYVQNTWRFGLDRILAGVAMSDDADRWFGTTLPLDDVGSRPASTSPAGWPSWSTGCSTSPTQLTGSHPVDHWLEALARRRRAAHGRRPRRRVADRPGAPRAGGLPTTPPTGGRLELRLPDVRALMAERLAGRPTRANFRTGTLTVCTMVPMRSVPHRVVCLLGLDDGVFPRAARGRRRRRARPRPR